MPSARPAAMHGTVPDNEKSSGCSRARAHSDFVTQLSVDYLELSNLVWSTIRARAEVQMREFILP